MRVRLLDLLRAKRAKNASGIAPIAKGLSYHRLPTKAHRRGRRGPSIARSPPMPRWHRVGGEWERRASYPACLGSAFCCANQQRAKASPRR